MYIVLESFVIAFSSAAYYVLSYAIRRLLEVNIQTESFKPLTGAELVALRTYMYHNFKGDQRVVKMIVDSFEITNTNLFLVLGGIDALTATLQSSITIVWFYLRLHAAFLLISICCALVQSRTRQLLVLYHFVLHVD